MALILSKTYELSGGSTPETYEVTYWRVADSHINVDEKKATIIMKGYKSKTHRNNNGVYSQFRSVRVRGAWVYTMQNINDFNALELAYMSVKQSEIDEGQNINWATAQDDVGN